MTIYSTTGERVGVFRTDGTPVWAGGNGGSVTPPDGPDRNVARMCSVASIGKQPQSANGSFSSTAHPLTVDVAEAVLAWDAAPGYVTAQTGGVIRAAVQAGDGPVRTVTFDGASTARLDPPASAGHTIVSDPVRIDAPAGTTLHVLAWIDADTTGPAVADTTSILPPDRGHGTGPWTTSPHLAPANASGEMVGGPWSLRPSRIVAPSDRPAWVFSGDSIVQQSWSWGEQALDALGYAAVKSGRGGDAYALGGGYARALPSLAYATGFIDEMGINDGMRSWDVTAPSMLQLWRKVRAAGIEHVIKSTITLSVGTSDDWATLEGQTVTSVTDAGRVAVNQWLRDGAPLTADGAAPAPAGTAGGVRCTVVHPDGTVTVRDEGHPLTAVTDVVAAIESSPDSGKYALGAPATAMRGWADGLHPSPGIHAILGERLARDLEILGH